MVCVPTLSVPIVRAAWPPLTGEEPIFVVPSKKVMVPVGDPLVLGCTLAVNVTD
jgi:hypothetical protein